MAPRLKVFATQIGMSTWVVAVTSQKEALKAWDVRDNLFASGAAKEIMDPAAIAAALKSPGKPVAFRTLEINDKAAAKEAPKPKPRGPLKPAAAIYRLEEHRARAPAPPLKPKPDRSKLDEAERALAAFEKEAKARRTDFARRRKALEAEMQRKRMALEDELEMEEAKLASAERSLTTRLERERATFERATSKS